jgi:predicted RNA-binding Zn-ribbon protein involved in translation (DUF1610 family)
MWQLIHRVWSRFINLLLGIESSSTPAAPHTYLCPNCGQALEHDDLWADGMRMGVEDVHFTCPHCGASGRY